MPRILVGLFWALGGAIVGFVVGTIAASVIAKVTNASGREGAIGYFMIALGIIGALIGLVLGVILFARTAPTGQGAAFIGSSTIGLVALVATLALGLWAFMYLREAPAYYGGSLANLELELRANAANVPADHESRWLSIEVQTSSTRPEGTVIWSGMRTEGASVIIPVVQGPLYRAGSRVIVVRMQGRQDDVFMPNMKRLPDPRANWSAWVRPNIVEPPYGVTPKSPLTPVFELRYRVRVYGD